VATVGVVPTPVLGLRLIVIVVVTVMVIASTVVVVIMGIVVEEVGLLNRPSVVVVAVVVVALSTPTPIPMLLRPVPLLQPVVAPLKALVVVAMGSRPMPLGDSAAALLVQGAPRSSSRVFPIPLQPLPSIMGVVPRSRREQLRHKTRVRLVTLLNLVLTALNAMASTVSHVGAALHAPLMHLWPSHSSVYNTVSSSSLASVPPFDPCVNSSIHRSILVSLFARVRSFDQNVRRRGEQQASQTPQSERSLAGLCDSLVHWLAALFASVSPLSMSSDPSLVFAVFPFHRRSLSSTLSSPTSSSSLSSLSSLSAFPLPTSFDYLRDAALRERAVPIVAHRIALPTTLTPVKLLDFLPSDQLTLYSAPSSALLLNEPRRVNRVPRIFGSHSEYVKLVRRLLSVGMVSITMHPKVINGVFAVPKDSDSDRLIIDAVFANA
jgi:hypothetical protein